MTTDQLKATIDGIVAELNSVADFAGVLDPGLVPFIAIGKAVDKQVPGLAAAVDGWISGNAPTDQEKADLMAQLSVLANPTLP